MEHTVPLTVTLRTEHADLGSLERAVDAALAEAGQALWAELVQRLEATLPVRLSCAPTRGRSPKVTTHRAREPLPARSNASPRADVTQGSHRSTGLSASVGSVRGLGNI